MSESSSREDARSEPAQEATPGRTREYAAAVGQRLRAIRNQQKVSLAGVEKRSGGRWKAVVLGSYERGDRVITVPRLAELAEFYGVDVADLLPQSAPPVRPQSRRVVLDLSRLSERNGDEVGPLARYAAAIQAQRGDYNNRVLSLRADDLTTLSVIYSCTPTELLRRLVAWGVLSDDAASEFLRN